MFNSLLKSLLYFFCLVISSAVHAVMIEAEGRAQIINGNVDAAREQAIRDASQQASMHAAVYVSSNQVVRDGILEVDNMQVSTLGRVSNIEILDEKVVENMFLITIRADVSVDSACHNGISNRYAKSVALTYFPLQQIAQANLGDLHELPVAFPSQMVQKFNAGKEIVALNASNVSLVNSPQMAGTSQLDDGTLTSMLSNIGQMDVNYTISGVIRDISMVDPNIHSEKNYFKDLYNRLDYKSKKHLRNFEMDIYVHDGFSGHLLMQKHYQTAGLWNLDQTVKTGFDTPSFLTQDYGKKVMQLQQKIIADLKETLRCEPFTARITRTQGRHLWISAGRQQGLQTGDKLTVYRRSTFYTPDMRGHTQVVNTLQTLIIDNVQPGMASGYLSDDAIQHNIRPGDLAISR